MKGRKLCAAVLATLAAVSLVSCGKKKEGNSGDKTNSNKFSVTYVSSQGETPAKVNNVVSLNDNMLPTLEQTGYKFYGWYKDANFFEKAVPANLRSNLTLYAKWVKVQQGGIFDSLNDNDRGYIDDKGYVGTNPDLPDFSVYDASSPEYRKVSTADELIKALADARTTYTSSYEDREIWTYMPIQNVRKNQANWDKAVNQTGLYIKNADGTYTQVPEGTPYVADDPKYPATLSYYETAKYVDVIGFKQELSSLGTVRVIEIDGDIDLGWNKISSQTKSAYANIVHDFTEGKETNKTAFTMSDMFNEHGISQIGVERTNNLLIYSKNGSKITHGGFKVNFSKNVVFRNIEMDEMWQWEDTASTKTPSIGDMDAFGWAYFKIGYSDNIWIDHCTFGKSYDGQIDVANPYYHSVQTYDCAPYAADGSSRVHISWCNFKAGSDDSNGYLVKMMTKIEEDYQASKAGGSSKYLYYKTLRDSDVSVNDILYGIAIPQKKAFLLNDEGNEYKYNKNLRVSIANCYFKNIEDRLPKMRSGVAYIYNNIFDNSEYYEYRTTLRAQNVSATVKAAYTGDRPDKYAWKCGLVSQGIVCGLNGSVAAKNCDFIGIQDILKNNDENYKNTNSNQSDFTLNGGYSIENCASRFTLTGERTQNFTNASGASLSTTRFSWRTEDSKAPFEVKKLELTNLESHLTNSVYGVGASTSFGSYAIYTRING